MKHKRSTTPVSKKTLIAGMSVVAAFVLTIAAIPLVPSAQADEYDEKIAALQQEINAYQDKAAQLSKQADTLQNKLNKLTNEKAQLQKQIDLSQQKYDKLAREIKDTEKRIEDNRTALGQTIADLSVDGDATPLMILAGSEDIGDFIDKQAYRESVRDTLVSTIKEIELLKAKLEKDKMAAERILADQKAQRTVLSQKQSEQQTLISRTKGQEAAYQKLSARSRAEQQRLEAEQQAALEAAMRRANGGSGATILPGDPSKGGYPYANYPHRPCTGDDWGFCVRECVSYAGWKVYQKNGYMPNWGGRGNAYEWDENARGAGIRTGSEPRVGSVAQTDAGPWGHVAWVEAIDGDDIIISQYNSTLGGKIPPGNYSKVRTSKYSFETYIYF